jgi:predicted PurR-regulated permease PerM
MDITIKSPFYAKAALIFISIFAFVFTMHVGQDIIIPILYATIIAILLNPLVNYLINKKVNRLLAITFAVILAIFAVVGLLYIISSQVTMFSETYPRLKGKFNISSAQLIHWIAEKFRISQPAINTWIKETEDDTISNLAIGEKISAAGRLMVIAMLLPVYLFMILYYKNLLLEFIRKLFRTEHHSTVVDVLISTKKIVQSYLMGLFFEMLIIAVLNSAGLLLLGIDYAIILGVSGAILNIIPYIGGIIAIALPMTIAYVTKDSLSYPALVFFVYLFIQFIDNHYIIPRIVAARVQLNALISVIVVLIGGAVWGIPGMFLSIPLTAITKVIFDHIEPLKPWGFLLGNIVPTTSRFSFIKQKNKLKAVML